jgi:acyl carrier protein
MTFKDFQEQVCSAVAEFRNDKKGVTPDQPIGVGKGSLGIDGDDAVELLAHLRKRFGITFQQFPFDRYFGPEGGGIGMLWDWLNGRLKPLEKFTVGDLTQFMWDERQHSGS